MALNWSAPLESSVNAVLLPEAANKADPTAVIPLLTDKYGADAEIDVAYSTPGNAAYIALYESEFTAANGLLSIDPARMDGEVLPGYAAAGETDLPTSATLLDTSILADALYMLNATADEGVAAFGPARDG